MAQFKFLNFTNFSTFLCPCRKSCQQNVFLESSLRKTGTILTHPTSIGMEKKARFTLLLSTKMGHLEMEQDHGDIRGLLTSCQGLSTRTEYRNCTGTYWARAEIEGAYTELVRTSKAAEVPILPWEFMSSWKKKGKKTGPEETHPRVWPDCLHGGSNQSLSGAEKPSWAMQHQEPVGDGASPGGHRG